MELLRRFVDGPPALQAFRDVKPTLLVSWWATFYAIIIILIRCGGRYVRAEKIFAEDGIMLLAIVPLLIRMAFVHVVLLFGTNNTATGELTPGQIHQRQIGSQLVLASRVMYAAYLWAIKYSVSMFLRTLTESVWQSSHQRFLRYLHIFLAATFVATVIADLSACQPFTHYWQVVPDPGPQCRQGAAHLLTMGILNIVTNLVLILFPLPMILKSRLSLKRQASIIARLALPLLSIILTSYTLPHVIHRRFAQPTRSVFASLDILLATFISNATVLISLLQDRGYKKTKYKHGTERDGFHVKGAGATPRILGDRGMMKSRKDRWGSDEDLMRSSDRDDLSKNSDGKGETVVSVEGISMVDLKRDHSMRDRDRSRSRDKSLPEPPKAKLREIRVANTWEIRVEDSEDV